MFASIDREEVRGSKSLLFRFVAVAILIACFVMGLVSTAFIFYADRLAIAQTKMRLADSVLLLAPVIDGAVAQGDVANARQILRNFTDQEGVICVDYRSSETIISDQTLPVVAINLPKGDALNLPPKRVITLISGFYQRLAVLIIFWLMTAI